MKKNYHLCIQISNEIGRKFERIIYKFSITARAVFVFCLLGNIIIGHNISNDVRVFINESVLNLLVIILFICNLSKLTLSDDTLITSYI